MSNTLKGLGKHESGLKAGKLDKMARPYWSAEEAVRSGAAQPLIDPSPTPEPEPSSVTVEAKKVATPRIRGGKGRQAPVKAEETKVEAKTVEPVTPPAPAPVEVVPETPAPEEKKVKPKSEKRRPAVKVDPVPPMYHYTKALWANFPREVSPAARTSYERLFGGWAITPIGREVILTILTVTEDLQRTLGLLCGTLGIHRANFVDTRKDWEAVTPQAWVDLLCDPPTALKKCLPAKKPGLGHGKGRWLMCDLLRADGFKVS